MQRPNARQRGSALVEFALAVPLVIALLYGSLYIVDLGLFKLKSQEASRYTAWAVATRPQSSYVTGIVPLVQTFSALGVRDEVQNLYSDLDGAAQWSYPGVSRLTAGGPLLPITWTNETAPVIPGIGDNGYASNLSLLGQIVRILGIGPNLDGVMASLFDKLGFNGSGYVKASAPILVTLPWIGDDAYRALLIANAGAVMHADLTPWSPVPGFVIADQDNAPIQTALLTDPWRLQQGFGVIPRWSFTTGFQLEVQRMERQIPRLIPLLGLALPGNPGSRTAVVVSRPYTQALDPNLRPGQVSVGGMTFSQLEAGAVDGFDTGAMFDDPHNAEQSPYYKEFLSRGVSFMGCTESMKRGCRD